MGHLPVPILLLLAQQPQVLLHEVPPHGARKPTHFHRLAVPHRRLKLRVLDEEAYLKGDIPNLSNDIQVELDMKSAVKSCCQNKDCR